MYLCYIKKKVNMFAKKVVSLVSSGENIVLPLLAPLQKYCWPTPWKSTIGPSLEKNPSGTHVPGYILIYRNAEGVERESLGTPASSILTEISLQDDSRTFLCWFDFYQMRCSRRGREVLQWVKFSLFFFFISTMSADAFISIFAWTQSLQLRNLTPSCKQSIQLKVLTPSVDIRQIVCLRLKRNIYIWSMFFTTCKAVICHAFIVKVKHCQTFSKTVSKWFISSQQNNLWYYITKAWRSSKNCEPDSSSNQTKK